MSCLFLLVLTYGALFPCGFLIFNFRLNFLELCWHSLRYGLKLQSFRKDLYLLLPVSRVYSYQELFMLYFLLEVFQIT